MPDKIDILIELIKEVDGNLSEKIDDVHDTVKTQNNRIRKLEIWRGKILGISAVIALVASLLIKYVL